MHKKLIETEATQPVLGTGLKPKGTLHFFRACVEAPPHPEQDHTPVENMAAAAREQKYVPLLLKELNGDDVVDS